LGTTVLLCVSAVAASSAAAGEAEGPLAIESFSMQTTEAKPGNVNEPYAFTRAGGHPEGLTTTLRFASEAVGQGGLRTPTRDPKDMVFDLPPGLLANPLAVSRCAAPQALSGETCPVDSQVGVFVLYYGGKALLGPIVDITPPVGQAAELALQTPFHATFPLTGSVVNGPQGYALALAGKALPMLGVEGVETTLWGIPAATVHDSQRGLYCAGSGAGQPWSCEGGGLASGQAPAPFLTMPSDCSAGPLTAGVWVDSWEQPEQYVRARSTLPAMTGCELSPFDPEIEVQPDTSLADEPVGVGLSIGSRESEGSGAVSTPPLREATVILPQGMSISPSVADGARACQPNGPEGIDMPTGVNAQGEALQPDEAGEGEEPAPSGEGRLAPGHCPAASSIGSAEAQTPLLGTPIKGRVYLAAPGCGGAGQSPCSDSDAVDGNLYRLYVELGGRAEHDDGGVVIKVEGRVQANPATGQLTVRLANTPQLPLSQLRIDLNGGPRALLDNPAGCGPATTTSDMEPWSAPGVSPAPESLFVPGTADVAPFSYYEVKGCSPVPALHPGLIAGTQTALAGEFSSFTTTLTRSDREPYLSQIQLSAPRGLSAMLSSVPLCEEALANSGECPEASRVGSSRVASGAGSHPFEMPGRIYLTGGYEGAPFGLSIVTDALAGPLNLGRVVIRARIGVDRHTAALTITSDPLPQIVLGVPLRIQRIVLDIDRAHFMFNPTDCTPQEVTATVAGEQGAAAQVSNRFALGGCRGLEFRPSLKAYTSARTSYGNGASLEMRLAFPKEQQGAEANLAQIKVSLPRHMPSRLTTLQNACPAATFEADPAACPSASIVGVASARTAMLSAELNGPIYLVSYGRRAFPSPTVVLQGEGVRLDLSGSTVVGKQGVASVAFNEIPDVPVASLRLYLPQGPHSLLGASAALCGPQRTVVVKRTVTLRVSGRSVRSTIRTRKLLPTRLPMPTQLVAHNGAVLHRTTAIEVLGCRGRG
jgi:hypothetical protein